jgi:hypothetical protein
MIDIAYQKVDISDEVKKSEYPRGTRELMATEHRQTVCELARTLFNQPCWKGQLTRRAMVNGWC